MSQFVYCYIVWKPHKLVYSMAAEKGHMTILEGKLHKLRINLCKRSYPGCNINFFMVITSYKNIVFYTPRYLFLFGICQTNILTSKFHPVLNMSACFKVFFPRPSYNHICGWWYVILLFNAQGYLAAIHDV